MAIEVNCNSCGKHYQAPDHLAGKKIKCRQCGTVFLVPAFDQPEELSESLHDLAAAHESFGGNTTIMTQGHLPIDLPVPDDLAIAGEGAKRRNVRLTYPGAAAVDRWLPIVLLVGGGLWAAMTIFNNNPDQPGLSAARLTVVIGAYLGVIFPMGLRGVHMAASDLGFMLPRTSTFRGLATFMPVFAVGTVLWTVSGGGMAGLTFGVILGFVISSGAMWLLFRLQPNELPAAVGYAGGMVALGLGIVGGLLIAMNALLSSALVSMHKADAVAASPLGVGFSWPKSAAPTAIAQTHAPAKTIAPPVAMNSPADNSPVRNPPIQNPPMQSPPPEAAPTAKVDLPPSAVVATTPHEDPFASKPAEPGRTALFDGAALPERASASAVNESPNKQIESSAAGMKAGGTDAINLSPVVESASIAPLESAYDALIRPATTSPWACLLKKGGDRAGEIDRVWLGAGNPPAAITPFKSTGAVPFVAETQAIESYALSPNGDLLAHVSKFPSLSVIVYSFKDKRIVQTVKLQESLGQATVLGFVNDERMLVHRQRDGLDGFELWDVKSNSRVKAFDTPHIPADTVGPVISPDGSMLAVTAVDTSRAGEPVVTAYVYDLFGSKPRAFPIADLNASTGSVATGMAFSADGTRLAILFEQGANGLLVIFKSKGAANVKPLLSQPMLPVPNQPQGAFNGSSLLWLGEDALLLYGSAILSSASGAEIANLKMAGVTSQAFQKPDVCELGITGDASAAGLELAKLKMSEISRMASGK